MLETIINKRKSLDFNPIDAVNDFYIQLKNNFKLHDSFRTLSKHLMYESGVKNFELTIKHEKKNEANRNFQTFDKNELFTFSKSFQTRLNKSIEVIYTLYTNDPSEFEFIGAEVDYFQALFDFISPILFITYLQEEIEDLKLQDTTTGLYNRKYLSHHLEKMLPLAQREQKKVGFLMIGIDHFKAVIDEFNYDVGDKVLQSLAELLIETLRTSDIVVRLDADEFLVALPNIINEENAIMVSNKLIEKFSETEVVVNEETNQTLKKTICIGISIYPDDSIDEDEILKNADISLYEARNLGRSSIFKYTKEDTSTIDLF